MAGDEAADAADAAHSQADCHPWKGLQEREFSDSRARGALDWRRGTTHRTCLGDAGYGGSPQLDRDCTPHPLGLVRAHGWPLALDAQQGLHVGIQRWKLEV
jgi:hypothetical protein